MTAQDVIASFAACEADTEDPALAQALSNVLRVEDQEGTVTVTLRQPDPDFLSYVSLVYITPAEGNQPFGGGRGPGGAKPAKAAGPTGLARRTGTIRTARPTGPMKAGRAAPPAGRSWTAPRWERDPSRLRKTRRTRATWCWSGLTATGGESLSGQGDFSGIHFLQPADGGPGGGGFGHGPPPEPGGAGKRERQQL